MTRPDVERAREFAENYEPVGRRAVLDLIDYIRAFEAALDAVLPKCVREDAGMHDAALGMLRDAFDAAVARWEP